MMQLEDYFDFLAPDDIRIKGSRVGIETVLYDHIHKCRTPEEIAQTYPTITLEQVHAAILYYLHHKESVTAYLNDWLEWSKRMREEQRQNPPPFLERLSRLKAEQEAKTRDHGASLSA